MIKRTNTTLDHIRVMVEEFAQWFRWDFLPELPARLLVIGSLAFFIWCSTNIEPTQKLDSLAVCEVPQSEQIAISD